MAKRMSDDEIMDYTFNKVFGDLDGIRSGSMFDSEGAGKSTQTDVADNAGTPGVAGIDISITPRMAAAAENEKPDDLDANVGEEKEDKLKGISKMSPLMAQLHGER